VGARGTEEGDALEPGSRGVAGPRDSSFGADVDSGTFDYFTAAIIGREGASRDDFTSSVNDNVLVERIANDELALGFLPLVYYEESRHRLKVVPIDNGKADDGAGPIAPSQEAIRTGTYQPLARPIFLYVREQALDIPEVQQFVDFYLAHVRAVAQRVGYLPLGEAAYQLVEERRNARWTGTVFGEGGSQVGLTLEQLLAKTRIR
jgi:phosphate transport system substrate-binding protein